MPFTFTSKLFFTATRQYNIPKFYSLLQHIAANSPVEALSLVLYIRSRYHGVLGQRELGRRGVVWLFINFPELIIEYLSNIVYFGRWDDLLVLFPTVLNLTPFMSESQNLSFLQRNYESPKLTTETITNARDAQLAVVEFMGNQLWIDHKNMENNLNISLCAKWAPTERCKLDREHKVVRTLCTVMGWSKTHYRQTFLTPLRKYLGCVVERHLATKTMYELDLRRIPSNAQQRLSKTLQQYYTKEDISWTRFLPRCVEASNCIYKLRSNNNPDTVQLDWNNQLSVNQEGYVGFLPVIDTSSSMGQWNPPREDVPSPSDIAIGLGLSVAQLNDNMIVSHSHNPESVPIDPELPLLERHKFVKRLWWSNYLDLDLVHTSAEKAQIDPSKVLLVITDRECPPLDERPVVSRTILWWNIQSTNIDFTQNDNWYYIQGYNNSILRLFISGNWRNPSQFVQGELELYNQKI
jgi:hypothetical protein